MKEKEGNGRCFERVGRLFGVHFYNTEKGANIRSEMIVSINITKGRLHEDCFEGDEGLCAESGSHALSDCKTECEEKLWKTKRKRVLLK